MNSVDLVFPHQLYAPDHSLSKSRPVYIIEYSLFFTQYQFHKQKLKLHRASMKYYEHYLLSGGYQVHYVDFHDPLADMEHLFRSFSEQGILQVHLTETVDYLLDRRLKRYAERYNITLHFSESPNFIRSAADNKRYFSEHKFFLTDYYISLRKELNILMDGGKPLGGKWTFDSENRKKMPDKTYVPPLPSPIENKFIREANFYIDTHFAGNYGSSSVFVYPITHADAISWLDDFLEKRFGHYGVYQDAIVKDRNWLFHSVITPMLNIGLLNPQQIIERAVEYAQANGTPLNSLEGFVRQILGWREYMRAVYEARGVQQRTTNYWQHTRPVPEAMWTGSTGIGPVDDAIRRLLHTGYNHHIERLMVLSNFMLLCEFDPDQVYRWYMEMYIDSYDWVMVPNVYGMGQYADGGLISTKPYISGSSYILKMSNHPKGEWCAVWDALFWRFIHKHKELFAKNPRMSMMAVQVSKMDPSKLNQHLSLAENFLNKIS